MKTLRAVYERDRGRAWTVRVPRLPGCHTYGRTLEQARARIHEAIRLWVDEPDLVNLVDDVRLPRGVRGALLSAQRARRRAHSDQLVAQQELRKAAASLERAGMSRRDAGELLGLSRQRVQQLRMASRGRRGP